MADIFWSVQSTTKRKVGEGVFKKSVQRAVRVLGRKLFQSFSIVIVGDARMRSLNASYRGKNSTTDVLSFSYLVPQRKRPPQPIEGDIFISLPVARTQAKSVGHSLENELNRLFVHGLLHLAGYDHEVEKEEKAMRKLEDRILGHRT